MKSLFALNYRNRKNMTQSPYNGMTFHSVRQALKTAQNVKRVVRKDLKVAKLVLEKV